MLLVDRLRYFAHCQPSTLAIAAQIKGPSRTWRYGTSSFGQLDVDSDHIAHSLIALGVRKGTRVAFLLTPGVEFVSFAFGVMKVGGVCVFVDRGLGLSRILKCIAQVEAEGLVASFIPQIMRKALGRFLPKCRLNVTVYGNEFSTLSTIHKIRAMPLGVPFSGTSRPDDAAAIVFTSGSTGPPKGVLYTHKIISEQVDQLQRCYRLKPGSIDLATFPLFGLFNPLMGISTVIPATSVSDRPGRMAKSLIGAIRDWNVSQSFASPATWNRLSAYCKKEKVVLGSLRYIYCAGASVPADVITRTLACVSPEAEMHLPYGATEALPVASLDAREALGHARSWSIGNGVCLGRRLPGIEWKIIEIDATNSVSMTDVQELPLGQIGELVVRGPGVTRQYVGLDDKVGLSKIRDGDTVWHRMGDLGYLDKDGRFWMCGRVSQRVVAPNGVLYTEQCELLFNQHPDVARSALVGVGKSSHQRPVIIIEPRRNFAGRSGVANAFRKEILLLARSHSLTSDIKDVLLFKPFPVDARHESKIDREVLRKWASKLVS